MHHMHLIISRKIPGGNYGGFSELICWNIFTIRKILI